MYDTLLSSLRCWRLWLKVGYRHQQQQIRDEVEDLNFYCRSIAARDISLRLWHHDINRRELLPCDLSEFNHIKHDKRRNHNS